MGRLWRDADGRRLMRLVGAAIVVFALHALPTSAEPHGASQLFVGVVQTKLSFVAFADSLLEERFKGMMSLGLHTRLREHAQWAWGVCSGCYVRFNERSISPARVRLLAMKQRLQEMLRYSVT